MPGSDESPTNPQQTTMRWVAVCHFFETLQRGSMGTLHWDENGNERSQSKTQEGECQIKIWLQKIHNYVKVHCEQRVNRGRSSF
jgi:hypothetical protein